MSGADLSGMAALLSSGIPRAGMPANPAAAWMGPGASLPPMAPPNSGFGRRFDYSQAANANVVPKSIDGGLTYRQMRSLAENCDYVTIAIQTVLDRLCATKGRIVDAGGDPCKPSAKADMVNDWMACPDGVTPLSDFLQMAAYDMCVIDAPTAYIDRSVPGKVSAYVLDGATIVANLDERGRVSKYGQVIKGMVAHYYGLDEIIWMPKNRRPHVAYGNSFVQQVQNIVALALRRTSRQLDWFGQGNLPDVLIGTPEGWTPDQIRSLNDNWEKQLAGISGKNKARWIPHGSEVHEIDRNPVAGEFDEWLIRVICYAFSLPPTAFVKQVNRSTSETMQDASVSEGHAAILRWAANFLTAIVTAAHGPGFRWEWNLQDPTKEDVIKLFAAGALKPEALIRLGFHEDEIAPAPAKPEAAAPKQEDRAQKAKEEVENHDHAGCTVRNADAPNDAETALAEAVQEYLDALKEGAVEVSQARYRGEAMELDTTPPKGFIARATAILSDAAVSGVWQAATMTPKHPANIGDATGPARTYAKERGAELVGKRIVDGKIIDNPNAEWQIAESARKVIRESVAQAFEDRWTPAQLSEAVSGSAEFKPRRALNIARTETATAQEAGSMAYFKAAGVTGKRWSDHDGCPICQGNAAQGVIPMGEAFQSGHMHAPAHPGGCRCRILPEELPE